MLKKPGTLRGRRPYAFSLVYVFAIAGARKLSRRRPQTSGGLFEYFEFSHIADLALLLMEVLSTLLVLCCMTLTFRSPRSNSSEACATCPSVLFYPSSLLVPLCKQACPLTNVTQTTHEAGAPCHNHVIPSCTLEPSSLPLLRCLH